MNSVLRKDLNHFAGNKKLEKFAFFVLPAIISIMLSISGLGNLLGNLISALSIFAGFLINAIIVMFSLMDKITATTNNSYVNYVSQVTEYMIFSLYLSIICVFFLITNSNQYEDWNISNILFRPNIALTFIAVYFTTQFFITLIKVVEKLYKIFEYNMSLRN